MKKVIVAAALAGAAACMVSAAAGALQLREGKWRVTTRTQSPLVKETQTQTTEECVRSGDFNPAAQMSEGSECRTLDSQNTADSVRWKMECGGKDMPAMTGEGWFETSGDTARGEMTAKMSFGGQNFETKSTWEGHYQGPCDQ